MGLCTIQIFKQSERRNRKPTSKKANRLNTIDASMSNIRKNLYRLLKTTPNNIMEHKSIQNSLQKHVKTNEEKRHLREL